MEITSVLHWAHRREVKHLAQLFLLPIYEYAIAIKLSEDNSIGSCSFGKILYSVVKHLRSLEATQDAKGALS